MNLPFWGKKPLNNDHSVVVDVSQDQVTAFWLSPDGEKRAVDDIEITKIPRYSWTTKNRLRQLSEDAAGNTVNNLINRHKIKPQKIETIIAPGLESGLGYLIRYNDDKKFHTSNRLVDYLVKAHENRIVKEMGEGGEPHLIKTDILETRLNGQKIAREATQEGSDLAITSYTGILPQKYLTNLFTNLKAAAFQAPVVWSSRLSLDVLALKNDLQPQDEAIVIDLAGYTTDILIYNYAGDIVTATFDLGLDTIIQNLAHHKDSALSDTHTLLKLYLNHSLHSRINHQLKQSLDKELLTFSAYLYNAFNRAMAYVKLPKNIILIVPADLSQYFADYLATENFHTKLQLPFPFEFKVLSTDDHLTKLLMSIYKAW